MRPDKTKQNFAVDVNNMVSIPQTTTHSNVTITNGSNTSVPTTSNHVIYGPPTQRPNSLPRIINDSYMSIGGTVYTNIERIDADSKKFEVGLQLVEKLLGNKYLNIETCISERNFISDRGFLIKGKLKEDFQLNNYSFDSVFFSFLLTNTFPLFKKNFWKKIEIDYINMDMKKLNILNVSDIKNTMFHAVVNSFGCSLVLTDNEKTYVFNGELEVSAIGYGLI